MSLAQVSWYQKILLNLQNKSAKVGSHKFYEKCFMCLKHLKEKDGGIFESKILMRLTCGSSLIKMPYFFIKLWLK